MSSQVLGWALPTFVAAIVIFFCGRGYFSASIDHGIRAGVIVAWIQSFASVIAMRWAWNKKYFYAVWAGSTLTRFLVFGVSAFVVHMYTSLNLPATLLALVGATTLFVVIESSMVFPKK